MSYIPDEITLTNYLYGELSEDESNKVEEYLKQNPAMAAEIKGLSSTREIMSAYDDKEVIPPLDLSNKPKNSNVSDVRKRISRIMAIAASVSLLLVVGYFTDFKLSYNDQGLFIGFKKQTEIPQGVTLDQIESLLDAALDKNLAVQNQNLVEVKTEMQSDYQSLFINQGKTFETKLEQRMNFDKQELDRYTKDLQEKNAILVNDYFSTAGLEQQTYVKNLLIDFTGYLEEQRVQDRDFYLNRLIDLKLSSDLKQQETEQMLTSIIKSVNNISTEETTQNF